MQAGVYKHYKGGYYQVLGVAEHTETGQKMVVYISLDAKMAGPRMRVRPLKGPEGFTTIASKDQVRFKYVGDEVTKE